MALASADLQRLLNVGPGTVSKWLKAGTIPSHRIGSTWITFRCDVTVWLASTANTPTDIHADLHPLEAYPPLLTPSDLETLFGKRRTVINGWLKDGTIPAYRAGSRWLIEKTVVQQVLRTTATHSPATP
jgi:excisionase family DNA binding protein